MLTGFLGRIITTIDTCIQLFANSISPGHHYWNVHWERGNNQQLQTDLFSISGLTTLARICLCSGSLHQLVQIGFRVGRDKWSHGRQWQKLCWLILVPYLIKIFVKSHSWSEVTLISVSSCSSACEFSRRPGLAIWRPRLNSTSCWVSASCCCMLPTRFAGQLFTVKFDTLWVQPPTPCRIMIVPGHFQRTHFLFPRTDFSLHTRAFENHSRL